MDNEIHIASGPNEEVVGVDTLLAGDVPAFGTRDAVFAASVGQYVPLDASLNTWAAGEPIAALSAFATVAGERKSIIISGCFNIDRINWPAGTTEAQVEAAMLAAGSNSNLVFRKLLYSDKRTGLESTLAGPGNEAGKRVLGMTPAAGTLSPGATELAAYSRTFATSNGVGDSDYTLTGTLPSGLTFNEETGVLSGTPADGTVGSYNFTVTGHDEDGNTITKSYTLAVAAN